MQGIMLAGGGLGMTIWPMLASQLISNYGWRTSYMIIGAIGLIVVTPIAQFMRRAPEQMEQSPHSRDEVKQENSNRQMMGHSLHQAVRTRKFWLLCAIYGCLWFSGNAIWVHLAIHATDLGISAASAATILAIMGGMSIAGRILMGSVADRIGYKLTLLIGFALMAAGLLWLLVAKELWAFYLFAVVFSFGPASLAALQAPLTAELFGLGSLGVILGGIECVSTVFGAISPILAGYIFDVTNSYRLVFLILATSSVIGLILSMLIRPTNNKGGGNDSKRST